MVISWCHLRPWHRIFLELSLMKQLHKRTNQQAHYSYAIMSSKHIDWAPPTSPDVAHLDILPDSPVFPAHWFSLNTLAIVHSIQETKMAFANQQLHKLNLGCDRQAGLLFSHQLSPMTKRPGMAHLHLGTPMVFKLCLWQLLHSPTAVSQPTQA